MSKLVGDPGYRPGWCIHYRAINNADTCEAGVVYNTLRPGHWPCFLDNATGRPKPDSDSCEKLRPPTPEEIAAHEVWAKGRMDTLIKVVAVVRIVFEEVV